MYDQYVNTTILRATYTIIPMKMRLWTKRHGNTGSGYGNLAVTYHCHSRNIGIDIPPTMMSASTTAEVHDRPSAAS